MRVLISNDDGINAPGLEALARAAAQLSEDVWVIAPDGNRSGYGHCITLRRSFKVEKVAPRRYICSGTPADCVIAGMSWVFSNDKRPDLVLSGINEGRNVAEDVSYSGTMAVAREAALCGIPGIAFSMPRDSRELDDLAIAWLAERIKAFWDARGHWAHEGHWLSVNLPRLVPAPVRAARIGRDKVAMRVIIHDENEHSAMIETLADRSYTSTPGDENHLIDNGFVSVTCLNWMGHASVPESALDGAEAKVA
jgi:5''/3''-nucleotidase SurE